MEHPGQGIAVVRVRGEIELVTLGRLARLITEQISRRPEQLVIDLTRVRFLASPGLAVLINAAKLRPGLRLVVTGGVILRSPQLVGQLVGLDQRFNLSPTVADTVISRQRRSVGEAAVCRWP